MSELALFGGPKAITASEEAKTEIMKWPIYTKEDEDAIVEVLYNRSASNVDVTQKFEAEFSKWIGTKYALGFCNGTSSIFAALYGVGVGRGDEVIMPSIVYWAGGSQAMTLGASVVFANIDNETLCIDPDDIEAKITPKTKAIVVVHYCGYPCDMDRIMAIAKKHNVKVVEDVSHAQGGLYKGRKLGTIGDVGAMSLMTGKSFAIGEGGMLVTDDREIYERAIALGHYERFTKDFIETESLKPFAGLPLGSFKFRMHQMSSAVGRVQLKYYDERSAQIRKAMNYFWDLLEGVPGIRAHRVDEKTGSTMGGWYIPHGLYVSEELGGLSVSRFCEAVTAEGYRCSAGANLPLHTHGLFKEADVYGDGKPTRIAFAERDVREDDKNLGPAEEIGKNLFYVPWLKRFDPELIEQYANAFKKVSKNYKELLDGDKGDPPEIGAWFFFSQKKGK